MCFVHFWSCYVPLLIVRAYVERLTLKVECLRLIRRENPTFALETLNFKLKFQAAKVMETGLQVQAEAEIVEKLKRFFWKQGGGPFST